MQYLTALRAYVAKFYAAAKSKVTTYVALATAGLSEVVSNWESAASLFPHWLVTQKTHIFAVAALVPMWTRIRREISGK